MINTIITPLTHPAQLAHVEPDVFDNEIVPEYLEAFLRDPRHLMFIAQNDTLVVGMISAVEYFHPDKPPQMWINEIGVAGNYRNQGIGRRLVQAVLAEAAARGINNAWLGTDVENKAAQACFQAVSKDLEPPQRFLLYEWSLK